VVNVNGRCATLETFHNVSVVVLFLAQIGMPSNATGMVAKQDGQVFIHINYEYELIMFVQYCLPCSEQPVVVQNWTCLACASSASSSRAPKRSRRD
jgi:hypothetical protein